MLNCFLPEFQQAAVLLVVPFHEGAVLLCLLPRSLLSQGACLLLIFLPQHLLLKLQTGMKTIKLNELHLGLTIFTIIYLVYLTRHLKTFTF